jgi:hypothetical protein
VRQYQRVGRRLGQHGGGTGPSLKPVVSASPARRALCTVPCDSSCTQAVVQGLLEEEDGAYRMGAGGAAEFGRFGIDVDRLEHRTRPLLRLCMDWSERRYHLAGSLGAALTTAFTERRWIATREASRIVTVTEAGQTGLRDWLGIDLAELRGAA